MTLTWDGGTGVAEAVTEVGGLGNGGTIGPVGAALC